MANDHERVLSIADKVISMAEGSLRGLDVVIRSWPAEFRAIIWEAVVEIASRRAKEARGNQR